MSLAEFMERIRGNRRRLRIIDEKLDWVYVQMFSVSSPVYDRVGSPSTVHENRLCELLDRENELNAEIKDINEEEALLQSFMKKLTDKELIVFKSTYFKCRTQQDTAFSMTVSQQCISQYLAKIEKKWISYSLKSLKVI
jgi:DNA-directed RNA polymerase specialized sigma subunit